ncbi:MAG: hypothetical protein OEY52_03910 [Gammaproteobacteria bacterium]|nr:hypothetical protein [Gammaproteobacteria bacterium]
MGLTNKFYTFLSLMVFLLLSSCASVPEELEMLDTTLNNYEKAMLWGEYNYILTSHKGDKMSSYQREKLNSIKVTSYEVLFSKLLPGGKKFVQKVGLKYYNRSYGVLRSLTVDQEWVFELERNAWVLLTPFPDFK